MKVIKRYVFLALLASTFNGIYAQQTKGLKPVITEQKKAQGVSRALVVGISDYQHPDITDLQYAHIDAQVFASYLTSDIGMGLDDEDVNLLINEQATSGKFVSALYKLLEESEEGDQVIVYFSGHGDVETTTMQQPGFLLCWDAPASVYMAGGTFPLAYLQDIISTLSIQKEVNVLLITDACRAGKLAGSAVGGTIATASALSQRFANETKLLSCQPDELALEGKGWGGGRGVFSYYLMAGLHGLADHNEDGHVTLREIERYLEDNVSESVAPHDQTPIAIGDKKTVLATVDDDVLANLKSKGIDQTLGTIDMRSAGIEASAFADSTDYELYLSYRRAMQAGHLLHPVEESAYGYYLQIKNLDALSPYINIIRRNLAAALQDEAQQAINDYLSASPKELRARWRNDDKYKTYPESLRTAAQLLGIDHFFYTTLMARSLYFEGLCLRLATDWSATSDSVTTAAIALQNESLRLDSLSPHTLNELGVLYGKLEDHRQSLYYHRKAVELSPTWILGRSNIAATMIDLDQIEEGIALGQQIYEADSTFLFNLKNLAVAKYRQGDRENSVRLLHEALKVDTTYGSAHSTLALLYHEWEMIDSAEYHYQAAEKLLPSNVQLKINMASFYLSQGNREEALLYYKAAHEAAPNYVGAIQGLIEYDYYADNLESAQARLIDYLDDYPQDGFAHYLLASIYARKGDQANCEKSLTKASKSKDIDVQSMIETTSYFDALQASDSFNRFLQELYDAK